MFKSGFQPVCVLYQGNQSPFDGSCQLVCRHQIQQEDINTGDTVTVIDLGGSNGSGTAGAKNEGPPIRQGIVMGQEMVSSLIAAQFKTKLPEETSPFQNKRRKMSDEQDNSKDEKDKLEMSLLRSVNSTVHALSNEVARQSKELAHIKQRQIQMMNLLDGVFRKREVTYMGESSSTSSVVHVQNREEESTESGPVISSVRSTAAGTGGKVMNIKSEIHARSSPVPSQGSESFEEGLYSVVKLSPEQEQGWEEDPGAPSTAGDKPRYLEGTVLDNKGQYIEKITAEDKNNQFEQSVLDNKKQYLDQIFKNWRRGDNVEIGNYSLKVMMPVTELEDILYKTNNATSFAYRLAGKCFTSREMLEGNTRGGGFRMDGEVFKQLNPDVVEMIGGEVKKRFPFSDEALLSRIVRNAINERARNERKKKARFNAHKFEEESSPQIITDSDTFE
ncbi:uncharacterized protein LOC129275177 [Lytechinus pictus]|uniref:uncharacterized protein LOC129275177 n=1 Tax=Lytechinus pictus TaxID=7653 RepID=UPI0030B9E566